MSGPKVPLTLQRNGHVLKTAEDPVLKTGSSAFGQLDRRFGAKQPPTIARQLRPRPALHSTVQVSIRVLRSLATVAMNQGLSSERPVILICANDPHTPGVGNGGNSFQLRIVGR